MRFQYAVLAKRRSYGSMSFSSLICAGSARRCSSPPVASDGRACDTIGSPASASVSGAVFIWSRAISASSITSASMTFSSDLVLSWLRSRRTVSWLASTSSVPPLTKPAMSTRWNGVTSSLAWIGVSMGISKYATPQATDAHAAARMNASGKPFLRSFFLRGGSIIDFLEQLVVLLDLGVVWFQRQRLVVGLAGLIKLSLVLVGDGQIVPGRSVGGIDFDGLLPPVDRFAPQSALRDVDPELDLRLGVSARVRVRRTCQCTEKKDRSGRAETLHREMNPTIGTALRHLQGI